jgi:hypothetical protein
MQSPIFLHLFPRQCHCMHCHVPAPAPTWAMFCLVSKFRVVFARGTFFWSANMWHAAIVYALKSGVALEDTKR